MYQRIERKIEETSSEDQFGFRKNTGTREAILVLRLIVEKKICKSTFNAFVDIEKAFDDVNWEIMFKIMKRARIATTKRILLYQLYKNEKAIIKMGDIQKVQNKERCQTRMYLSPLIFNAYIQEAIDIIRERIQLGIKVNGYRIDMLRFADNIAIIAENEKDLINILETLKQAMKKDLHNMKINTQKNENTIMYQIQQYKNKNKIREW